jgi:membrane protein DedA with SNARE-associated domain
MTKKTKIILFVIFIVLVLLIDWILRFLGGSFGGNGAGLLNYLFDKELSGIILPIILIVVLILYLFFRRKSN